MMSRWRFDFQGNPKRRRNLATANKPNLSKYERKLREVYARLRSDQQAVESTGLHGNMLDGTGEISGHDNHPGDLGTEVFLRERDMLLEQNLDSILRQCERALQKIEDGTYGYSDQSG